MKNEKRQAEEILEIVHEMFSRADEEGLYVGIGKDANLPNEMQEGPKVKRLRKLHDNLLKQRLEKWKRESF